MSCSLSGKRRYTVPTPTPARRAISSSVTDRPSSANASRAASRIRWRLRSASRRSGRSEMGGEVAMRNKNFTKVETSPPLVWYGARKNLRGRLHLERSTPLSPNRGHRMQEPQTNPHHARRWLILLVIAIAQPMVALDATRVNIALPSPPDALAFGGGAIVLILGGVLTEYLNWRWCLFVNLAFAVPAMLAAVSLFTNEVPEQRARIDVPGTLTATSGLFAIVYGLANAETQSWTDPVTVGMLVAGALLLVGFVVIQRRSPNPLLPMRVVLDRDRGGSFVAMLLSGAGMFAVFLFLTYYTQQTLGFSPIQSGLAFLPMTLAIVISAVSASTILLPKIGPRPLIGGGMLIASVGLLTLTSIGVDTSYAGHVLPGIMIIGAGLGLVFSAAMATATFGVEPHDAGVASAMVNTTQQIGGSIGTALLSTLAASAVTSSLASIPGKPDPAALATAAVHGYTTAFWWAAGIYAVGGVICAALLTSRSREAGLAPAGEPALVLG